MPEPIEPKEDKSEGKQDNNVEVDAFGIETHKEPEVKDEGKKEEGKKEDKKVDTIPEDHPVILALKQQIADIKKDKNSMGENLSKQRDLIEKLEAQIEQRTGKKEGGDTSHLPFDPKEIIYSKDLPKEKLDDMTDNEIKLHDELMKNREVMNKEADARYQEKKQGEVKKEVDLNSTVRSHAEQLAGGDKEVANEIIESVKQFNLQGLNEDEVKKRVENAYKLLPSYQPPKENITKKGGAVKGTEDKSDPFGTNKIVEEVASQRNGKTFAL